MDEKRAGLTAGSTRRRIHGRLRQKKNYSIMPSRWALKWWDSSRISAAVLILTFRTSEGYEGRRGREFGVLLIKRLDRLGRDMPKTMELLMGMEQIGIKVYSPLEGEISFSQYKELYDGYCAMILK